MMESPTRAPADHQVMTEWLRRLGSLTAAAVHPSQPGMNTHLPGVPVGSVQMAAGQVSLAADFYQAGDAIVVRRSDQPALRFELPARVLPLIFPDPFTLRDRHLIRTEAAAISLIELGHQDRPDKFVRTRDGWARDNRPLSREQSDAIERWVADLHLSEGSAPLPTLAGCGIRAPTRWGLTLRGANGELVGRLELARTRSCGDVATLPSGEWVRLQGTSLIDDLPVRTG